VLGGLAVVIAGGGLLLGMGVQAGYPASRPRLLSGSAWLASRGVGQMTLLDGSSVEVAAQVRVAKPGDHFDVVQQGAIGYAVNRSSGTISRVDGATFEVTPPVSPMPDVLDGLYAFAGTDALYALDSLRGVLASVDPQTLAPRGRQVSLATQINEQAAALDSAGRLWVLDTAAGDLVWMEHGHRHARRNVASPSAGRLVLAGGGPVVVDSARRSAFLIDVNDGSTQATVALDLRGGDQVQLSGSSHNSRIYLAMSRGVLDICDVAGGSCANAVSIGKAGAAELGTPVETGGRVFVPDYTSGKVWIIDLNQSRVVAQPQVLDPKTRFQLLTRDGVVFFNDPDSEHAGVIQLDGGVRRVPKYNPKDPDKGLSYPEPKRNPSPSPTPSTSPSQQPSPTPSPRPSPSSLQPATSSKPPVKLDRMVRISVSKMTAVVNEDLTFKVTANAGPAPTSVRWDFGDGQSSVGLLATHHWSAAQTYQVSVRVTFPNGQVASASLAINIVAQPSPSPTPSTRPTQPAPISVNRRTPGCGESDSRVVWQAVRADVSCSSAATTLTKQVGWDDGYLQSYAELRMSLRGQQLPDSFRVSFTVGGLSGPELNANRGGCGGLAVHTTPDGRAYDYFNVCGDGFIEVGHIADNTVLDPQDRQQRQITPGPIQGSSPSYTVTITVTASTMTATVSNRVGESQTVSLSEGGATTSFISLLMTWRNVGATASFSDFTYSAAG
jgi:hypothetical protein